MVYFVLNYFHFIIRYLLGLIVGQSKKKDVFPCSESYDFQIQNILIFANSVKGMLCFIGGLCFAFFDHVLCLRLDSYKGCPNSRCFHNLLLLWCVSALLPSERRWFQRLVNAKGVVSRDTSKTQFFLIAFGD